MWNLNYEWYTQNWGPLLVLRELFALIILGALTADDIPIELHNPKLCILNFLLAYNDFFNSTNTTRTQSYAWLRSDQYWKPHIEYKIGACLTAYNYFVYNYLWKYSLIGNKPGGASMKNFVCQRLGGKQDPAGRIGNSGGSKFCANYTQ